jgi:hypothetical protein
MTNYPRGRFTTRLNKKSSRCKKLQRLRAYQQLFRDFGTCLIAYLFNQILTWFQAHLPIPGTKA